MDLGELDTPVKKYSSRPKISIFVGRLFQRLVFARVDKYCV